MDAGGTRDEHYDLVSVLYHALHGADNCDVYLMDAEEAGRDELAAFFREAKETQTRLAERAKELLGITPGADDVPASDLTGSLPETLGPDAGVAPPGEVPLDAPRTEDVPPRTGDAPPSPSEAPSPGS